MKKLNKKGFTLVELLAVIVILALLMVVGIRTIGNLQNDSQFEAAKTEGAKMASKNYEDMKTQEVIPAHTKTYSNLLNGQEEGEFKVWINEAGTKICVTYKFNSSKPKKVSGTISNGVVNWGSVTAFTDGACENGDIS